jgi:hypothetical protein
MPGMSSIFQIVCEKHIFEFEKKAWEPALFVSRLRGVGLFLFFLFSLSQRRTVNELWCMLISTSYRMRHRFSIEDTNSLVVIVRITDGSYSNEEIQKGITFFARLTTGLTWSWSLVKRITVS